MSLFDMNIIYGATIWLAISAPVILLSPILYSPRRPRHRKDYDNRWPGYPLRPGDEGYDPRYRGALGNLPARYDHGA